MDFLIYFLILTLILVIGFAIGSFLNVVIDRLPRGEGIVWGRSHCDHCKRQLAVRDLIPLVSFLTLSGKCRYCKKKLSWYYPIVEATTGILFVVTVVQTGLTIETFYYLFVVSTLVVICFTDLKYGIIPFKVVLAAFLASFVWYILFSPSALLSPLLAAVGAFVFFFLIFAATRGRGMGFGDVVYAFLMGFLLGYPTIVLGLYIAFLTGAVVSLLLIALQKKKFHGSTVPFGPFLVFGTVVSIFWGQKILALLMSYLTN